MTLISQKVVTTCSTGEEGEFWTIDQRVYRITPDIVLYATLMLHPRDPDDSDMRWGLLQCPGEFQPGGDYPRLGGQLIRGEAQARAFWETLTTDPVAALAELIL